MIAPLSGRLNTIPTEAKNTTLIIRKTALPISTPTVPKHKAHYSLVNKKMAKIDVDYGVPSLTINGETIHYPEGTSVQRRVEDISKFNDIVEELNKEL